MAEPPITIAAAHTSTGPNQPVARVVIHTTSPGMKGHSSSAAGMAISTARYFANPSTQGSAHYIVDIGDEQHCVKDAVIAWHAPPNSFSVGIEICGEPTYARADWLAADVWPVVERAASRTRELCHRLGVPPVRIGAASLRAGAHGICGHNDVSAAFGETDHWDPGGAFPWGDFMALVTGDLAPEKEEESMVLTDPATGGVWVIDSTGAVFAYDGAPYLGGCNNERYNGAGWPCVGIATFTDRSGDGYCLVLDAEAAREGDRFRRYRFPRDGSAKV